MNYVFFGTPEFAAIILRVLLAGGYSPAILVCNPDRPAGRKKIITPPPTKQCVTGQVPSIKGKIQILQPEKLDDSFKEKIISQKPDFAVVVAYAKIIPQDVLSLFPKGIIGVHPSLLPKYRGSSPIQSAILSGEKETGVTLYLLDEKMDRGPIIAQRELAISPPGADLPPADNFPTLLQKLAELGGNLLVDTLPKFIAGEIKSRTQNEMEATYTKKFISEDGFVGENELKDALSGANAEKAIAIERKIRALNPEPGVWTIQRDKRQETRDKETPVKRVKLLEAEIKDAKLVLKKIQKEGGKPTTTP